MEETMKDMHCRDTGTNCGFVAQGKTDDDVKQKAAAHAWNAHGIHLTPEVERAIEALIHDEDSDAHRRSLARPDEHVSFS